MNILAIGNSFSQDATRYLHGIARADKKELSVANLYFGGCSLEQHFRFMQGDAEKYQYEYNGFSTGVFIHLKEALLIKPWDVITVQQASHDSPHYDTYQPYLDALVAYVRALCPKAKLVVHQTWAYEKDSPRLLTKAKYDTPQRMLEDIKSSYRQASQDIGAAGIIPSGELFEDLLSSGIERIHRDTFHARYGVGRYALALLWYRTLTGASVTENTFSDFDEEVSEKEMEIVKTCVEHFSPLPLF